MTRDEHRERHQQLHRALDELFADFIQHHPMQVEFTTMPLSALLEWSFQQTIDPSDQTNAHERNG